MRLSNTEFYLRLAYAYAQRSTCPRASVGAVVVSPVGIPIGLGYNGSPRGLPHCTEVGCDLVHGSCQRVIHAEVNAICHALRNSGLMLLNGCGLFVTHFPCRNCFNLAANMLITEITYIHSYNVNASCLDGANKLGIKLVHFENFDEKKTL